MLRKVSFGVVMGVSTAVGVLLDNESQKKQEVYNTLKMNGRLRQGRSSKKGADADPERKDGAAVEGKPSVEDFYAETCMEASVTNPSNSTQEPDVRAPRGLSKKAAELLGAGVGATSAVVAAGSGGFSVSTGGVLAGLGMATQAGAALASATAGAAAGAVVGAGGATVKFLSESSWEGGGDAPKLWHNAKHSCLHDLGNPDDNKLVTNQDRRRFLTAQCGELSNTPKTDDKCSKRNKDVCTCRQYAGPKSWFSTKFVWMASKVSEELINTPCHWVDGTCLPGTGI